VERGVAKGERRTRVVGQHEYWGAERRLAAPPAAPAVVVPGARASYGALPGTPVGAYHGAARQHWRDQPVQGLRQAGNHADSHISNHTRYREGCDLMTGVTLNATDAAELAEMLQFLAGKLKLRR
jgi:hypothetical protein